MAMGFRRNRTQKRSWFRQGVLILVWRGIGFHWLMALTLTEVLVTAHPIWARDAGEKAGWVFSVEPYVLIPSIRGDASLGRVHNVAVDISTGDIFDHLKMAGMVHLEGCHKNKWGLFFDFGFLELDKETPGIVNGIYYTTGIKQTVMELFLFDRTDIKGGLFDLFLGVRRWKNKIRLERSQGIFFPPLSLQRDENWVDAVIGARFYLELARDWQLMVRADIGGLGLASDFTAKAVTGVSYRIGESILLNVQYQALWVDYESGIPGTANFFAYDTITHGPALWAIFKF